MPFAVRALLAAGLVLSMLQAACAADAFVVGPGFEEAAVGRAIGLLEDPHGSLTFDAVRSSEFASSAQDAPTFGFTSSVYWARLTLRNAGADARTLVLRQDYPLIDLLDVWQSDGTGGWAHSATGDLRPFDSREYAHRDFLFQVDLPGQAEHTVYLRYQTAGALNIALTLYDAPSLVEAISGEQLAYGVYYGGFLMLLFYNLFVYLAVRDRAYFAYLLYVLSYGLYFGVHNGLSFQYLWPDSPAWGNLALLVLLSLTLVFGLQFSRLFLDTRSTAPRLDMAARALQGAALLALVLSVFLPYAWLIAPTAYLTLFVTGLILAMGTAGLLRGYRPARYFMIAWAVLLLGVFVYMFKTLGWLPHNALTQNAFQVGALLEMGLLSIALAARVGEIQRQSITDPLTQLGNRRYFDERLSDTFARAQRRHLAVALLVADIDHFKSFNDRHGHARGDEVLRQVARHLRRRLPRNYVLARYGGEEFAIILPGMDGPAATEIAEALRTALLDLHVGEQAVTISIGVASTADAAFLSPANLFDAADRALYRAKSEGRNRVCRYLPGLNAAAGAPSSAAALA